MAAMFPGVCGHLGVGGWALIGLFWGTFFSLVLWAVSRLFSPSRVAGGPEPDVDDLDRRWAGSQTDLDEYRALWGEPPSRGTIGTRDV